MLGRAVTGAKRFSNNPKIAAKIYMKMELTAAGMATTVLDMTVSAMVMASVLL